VFIKMQRTYPLLSSLFAVPLYPFSQAGRKDKEIHINNNYFFKLIFYLI
jgi:hypothetical protein